ncbi:Trimethylguanosine synthase [Armadillidium nasatum]|uniref:Trimethylguanosine synthase n=1 Tax=Armadillidium nasatum TaxID=96803 RepID=A0A5N5SUZ9_9CRUS|nr:Trimethylguanosine synthase [Armadillidium nasatum]
MLNNPDPDLPGESSPDVQVHGSPSPRNEEDQREEKDDIQVEGEYSPARVCIQLNQEEISDESKDLSVSPPQPFLDIEAEGEDSSSDDIIIEDDNADDSENLNVPPPQPIQDIQVEGVDSSAQDCIQIIQDDDADDEDFNVPPPQPILDIQVEGVDSPAQDRIQMIQDDNAVENNDLIIPLPGLFQDVPPPQPLEEVASNVIQEQVLTEEERENDEIQVNPPVPINEDEGNDGLQLERVDSTVSYGRQFVGYVHARFSHLKRMIMREKDEIQVNPPVPAVSINEDERNDGLQLQRVDSTINYGRHLAGGVLARFSHFRNAVFLRSDSYLSWLNPILRPRSSFGFRFYGYYSDYWWFSYKLQVKYRAENIMQRMEKECVEFLKICNPELDNVLFYPPLMPCENEHITECWHVRTPTYRVDQRFMRICILGKQEIEKDIGARNISIVYLNKRNDQPEELNELKFGDIVPMELEVFEKEIMRSFQPRTVREAEEEDDGEPFPRTSSAAAAVPPEESFLSGDLITNYVDEILNFCEVIHHDASKFDLRNIPWNFNTDYLKFWMRRHTFSSLYSKGIEITEMVTIDKNPANIQSARKNARVYGVEHKIIFKVGDFSTMDLSEFEPGAIFLNPATIDPKCILKEYDVLSLGGKSDCKKLLDDARKISPNIVLYLPPHSKIFQVLEVCKPFGKAEIQFNNVCDQKESICVYFGDFVH